MHAAEFWNERVEITLISFDMGRRWWIGKYDPSRTLSAENSPLKAETEVRFP